MTFPLSDSYFPEKAREIGFELRVRRVARDAIDQSYWHFIDWPNPENQTTEQYNVTVTNVFFHLVREGESAVGADAAISEAIDYVEREALRHDIIDNIRTAHDVMKPRWFDFFEYSAEVTYD